jgi:quercetin dioxygenase-like cupin family protein
MAKIRIVDSDTARWMTPKEGQGGEMVEVDEPGDLGAVRYHHPGSDSELYLHEAHTAPNVVIEPHVHREDEIIYVTDGELRMGSRVLTPGCSVYIPANTLYGFTSGPDGVSFLNFRGRRDTSHVSKDEFLAERAAGLDRIPPGAAMS